MNSRICGIFLGLLLMAASGSAQAADKVFAPPATPLGKCAADYFTAFNAGEDAMKAFFLQYVGEQSLKERPVEERLARYRGMRNDLGRLRPDHLIRADSESVSVLVEADRNNWLMFAFQFDSVAPHKLLGIRIEQTDPSLLDQPRTPMTEREFLDSLERRLDKMSQSDEFSGVVLVAKDGKPIFQKPYGLANKEFDIPNRMDTKFNLGSINKFFTKVAIGQLLQQGKVRLEDTLGTFLPDYPNAAARSKVTVEHLVNTTSGIGDFFNERFDNTPKDRFRNNRDYLPMFDSLALQFEPGAQRQYSNGGYAVLGAIIEEVSGQSYYEYVRQHVFAPAGMTNTDSYEADMPVANLAEGYTRPEEDKAGPWRKNIYSRPARGSAAGGGYSTAEDLLKFTIALQENILFSPAYTEWQLTGTRPDTTSHHTASATRSGPSAGIGIAGGAPGINAAIEADFTNGYTIIVLGNYDPPNAERVAAQARRWLERVTMSK